MGEATVVGLVGRPTSGKSSRSSPASPPANGGKSAGDASSMSSRGVPMWNTWVPADIVTSSATGLGSCFCPRGGGVAGGGGAGFGLAALAVELGFGGLGGGAGAGPSTADTIFAASPVAVCFSCELRGEAAPVVDSTGGSSPRPFRGLPVGGVGLCGPSLEVERRCAAPTGSLRKKSPSISKESGPSLGEVPLFLSVRGE